MKYFTESNNTLRATFKCSDFKQAFAFMTEVAFYAECQNHHPNWSNVYNTVEISLSTHDAGNIVTEKDHKLAKAIENAYEKYKPKP
jgi:4a-hydroxytetrahydrobiopterin dehydratase